MNVNCPYCHSSNTELLYTQSAPMLNITFACSEENLKKVKFAEFEALACQKCWLGFNSKPLPPNELSSIYEMYLIQAPSMNLGRSMYEAFLNLLKANLKTDNQVMEIGCSDGYLLSQLKEMGFKKLSGVEPSPLSKYSENLDIPIYKEFLSEKHLDGKEFDAFILCHVYEHLDDPFSILKLLRKYLKDGGKILVEVPYYSAFCHEHLWYYNLAFIEKLGIENGLKLSHVDIEGRVLRYIWTATKEKLKPNPKYIEEAREMTRRARAEAEEKEEKVREAEKILKSFSGQDVFWWGSGQGSVALLNRVKPEVLKDIKLHILDGDPGRWGLRLPGVGYKIESYEPLRGKTLPRLMIASSFYKEIEANLQKLDIHAEQMKVCYL